MLADTVELARRVDTHKHTHTAAVVAATTGAVIAPVTVAATPAGYRQLLAVASQQPGQRVWAVESTGGYGGWPDPVPPGPRRAGGGAGPAKRAARRHGANPDPLDATRAAREAWAATSSPSPQRPATVPRAQCG